MRRRALAPAAAAAALGLAGCAAPEPAGVGRGRVVVLRGLANVFSTGMDRLAARLAAAGYRVELGNHLEWRAAAGRLVAAERSSRLPRPVAVIGHSLGADDAIRLAGTAGEAGVATDLLVTFDPVWVSRVSTGPRRVLNFYLAAGDMGPLARRRAGLHGHDRERGCRPARRDAFRHREERGAACPRAGHAGTGRRPDGAASLGRGPRGLAP